MPPKTLLRAAAVTLVVAIFLFWSVLVWLRAFVLYPSDERDLALVLFWFCVSLAGAGGFLLLLAALGLLSSRWKSSRGLRMFPGMVMRNVLPWPRHRPMPLITQLPNFGLIYGAVLWILIFLFIIVEEPRHYCGLPIDFRTYDSVVWEKSPWQETLGVYLAVGEKYYINGEPVPRDALRTRLQQELNKRMVWTVYFEADYDTLNMDAIYAMDAIQGLGAKLVWITPKVREKLQQKEQFAKYQLK